MHRQLADYFAGQEHVVLAYLFGSRVDGSTGPRSDWDVGVLLGNETGGAELRVQIAHVLGDLLGGADVDVVLLNGASIELAYSVIGQGEVLYQQSMEARVEYEARVLARYGDYLPVLRKQRQELIDKDAHAARVQRYRAALRRTERTLGALAASS